MVRPSSSLCQVRANEHSCQARISNFGIEFLVQQDIWTFDICTQAHLSPRVVGQALIVEVPLPYQLLHIAGWPAPSTA